MGNPGSEYAATRHNVGYRIVDLVARRHRLPEWRRRGNRLETRGALGESPVILVKPLTYMNRSGDALATVRREEPFELDELLVCYDDFWLPLGRLRLRPRGSHGGHKGMRSIVARFSEEFPRLRVGIAPIDAEGRVIEPADATEFVLEDFQRSERLVIEGAIERAADAVERTVTDDLTTAMNQFNAIGG